MAQLPLVSPANETADVGAVRQRADVAGPQAPQLFGSVS